jgi:hypothetical protein
MVTEIYPGIERLRRVVVDDSDDDLCKVMVTCPNVTCSPAASL